MLVSLLDLPPHLAFTPSCWEYLCQQHPDGSLLGNCPQQRTLPHPRSPALPGGCKPWTPYLSEEPCLLRPVPTEAAAATSHSRLCPASPAALTPSQGDWLPRGHLKDPACKSPFRLCSLRNPDSVASATLRIL